MQVCGCIHECKKNEGKTLLTNKTPQKRFGEEITVNIKYCCPEKVVAGVSPHKNYVSKLEKSVVRKGGKRVSNRD